MNQQQKKLKIILIGDNCIDEYQYGNVSRLSPEAPVPIFVPNRNETKYGMGANVCENFKKLNVNILSYLGLQSKKIRMIDEKSNQHIIRIDQDKISPPLDFKKIKLTGDINAIVVSDYDKGFITYELLENLIQTSIPVFIDTKKKDLKRLDGAFIKINLQEYNKTTSLTDKLIVTLGKDGVQYKDKIFSAPNIEITDVCGAGDTFLASFVYNYLHSNEIESAIEFAIKASSVTVQHRGVYAPTIEEILCLK